MMEAVNVPLRLTAAWLRERYAEGSLEPETVVGCIVERAAQDADMGIWITPPTLEAVMPYVERLRELNLDDYPLWGIPFAIKDNINLAGVMTTAGCEEYAYCPEESASVVKRLIDAGAIPLGKTNLDQFATGLVGMRSPYGETWNALRPELISGGSSSGSAVAVARGQAAFSLGTDTAGSGRVPAALNGLVGYKPSLGAWPTSGVVPACASLDCVTVFAHTLDDVLKLDEVTRGLDSHDPWSRELPGPGKTMPAVVYIPEQEPEFYGPFASEYRKAWQASVKQLKSLGVRILAVDCEFLTEAAAILYNGPWIAERWSSLGAFVEANPGTALPVTESILRGGADEKHTASSLFQAMHRLQLHKQRVRELLRDGVLMLPTCGGTWTREQARMNPISTNSAMGNYTNHCNLLDLCAVALPAGEAAEQLPFGITMFALGDREDLVRGAAELWTNDTGDAKRDGSTAQLAGESAYTSEGIEAGNRAKIRIAVCGLHMQGLPLEREMLGNEAQFICEDMTAPHYRLVKIPSEPPKPGLIRQSGEGVSLKLELWDMPIDRFGAFTAAIPAPLGIGRIELLDGSSVPGFLCEAYIVPLSEDITAFGGWRAYLEFSDK